MANYTRFIVTNGQTLILTTGATYSNHTIVSNNGGAGEIQPGGFLNVSTVSFIDNNAVAGGAIFIHPAATTTSSGTSSNTFTYENPNTNTTSINLGSGCMGGTQTDDDDVCLFGDSSDNVFPIDYDNGAGTVGGDGIGVITASTFRGNSATVGGAIYNAGIAKISDSMFGANIASSYGGAIYNAGTMTLSNSTFRGNSAATGGAIYNADTSSILNLTNNITLQTECDTIYNAGTLNWDLSNGTVSYGKFVNYQYLTNIGNLTITVGAEQQIGDYVIASGDFTNVSGKETFILTGIAGADTASITINGETVSYHDFNYKLAISGNDLVLTVKTPPSYLRFVATFTTPITLIAGNTYTNPEVYSGNGGAGEVQLGGILTAADTTLAYNTATSGGAIYNAGTANISDAIFLGNMATCGGAVYNTLFYENPCGTSTQFDYGDGCMSGTQTDDDNVCLFGDSSDDMFPIDYDNTSGTGAEFRDGEINIGSSTFTDNIAENGGAIYNAGTATINGSMFSGNSASQDGGAVYNTGFAKISGATFSGNISNEFGGAIDSQDTVTLSDSMFIGNSASTNGGAIYNTGMATISKTVFSGNSATSGGAIYNTNTVTINGSTFSGNTATTVGANYYYGMGVIGGAIYNTRAVIINESIFSSNSAFNGAGALYNNSKATVSNSTFSENFSHYAGGAIYNQGTVTISGSIFDKSESQSGGVICNQNIVTVSSSTFSSNSATNGGAIYNFNAATVSNSSFSGNTASTNGGAIHNAGVIGINASAFNGNAASINGGAIYNAGTMTIRNSTLNGNVASINGGAIYNDCTVSIKGSTFCENSATSFGGAIYNTNAASISGSMFDGNFATSGGAIYSDNMVTIGDSTFSGNSASSCGGAIYNTDVASISYSVLIGNFATSGGAIYSNNMMAVGDSLFSENSASCGGAFQNNQTASISNSTFTDNDATYCGGAICNNNTASISGSTFSGNNAAVYGGAICNDGTMNISNSAFCENTASCYGGAIYTGNIYGSSCSIANTLFRGNTAASYGGAIYNSDSGILTLSDSTFSGNSAATGGAIYMDGMNSVDITIEDSSFIALSDTIYNANANASLTLQGTVSLGADFYSASVVDCSEATLKFIQTDSITVNAQLSDLTDLVFSGNGAVTFTQAQDFSGTEISITCGEIWKNDAVVVAEGNFTFAENQEITIHGYAVTLNGEKGKLGYAVKYEGNQLIVSQESNQLAPTEDENYGEQLCEWVSSTESMLIDFGSSSCTTTKVETGTTSLVAESEKHLVGGGASVTSVELNLYGSGHDVVVEDLSWNKYVFGGGLDDFSDKGAVTVKGDTSVGYACGGSYVNDKSTMENCEESEMVLTLDGATGSSTLICAGNFVNATATKSQEGNEILNINETCDVSNTSGYVMGGSVVSGSADYTFMGGTTVTIASGYYERVLAGGLVQGESAKYTHVGDINLTMTGGTVGTILFGGIGSNLAANGIKTIEGNINLTLDSSKRDISLYSVFGGCNGNGTIEEDVNVTFTGLGEKLHFKNTANGASCVIGDNAWKQEGVKGIRTLTFDNFQGDFTARIVKKFDRLTVENHSQVIFTQVYDLSGINRWEFDADSSLTWKDLHKNSFEGDTLIFGNADDEPLTGPVTFFSVSEEHGLDGFDNFSTVELFGAIATYQEESGCWTTDNYTLSESRDESTGYYQLTIAYS